jgi:hypothetical protein
VRSVAISRGDPILAASCPAIWGPFDSGPGAVVTVQRYLPGFPAYAQLRVSAWPRGLVAGQLAAVAQWLSRFWAATAQPARSLDENLVQEHIEKPLLLARERLGRRAVPEAGLQATLKAARTSIGQPVTIVAQHGDLWSANLLVRRAGLAVVDWEHFVPEALPAFDMLLFCTAYAMDFPWRPFGWVDHRAAFARTFLRHTWFARHVKRFLGRCCASSGLPRELVPVMLPVTLARMALRRTEGLSTDAALPRSSWLDMLEAWWHRPANNWLERWSVAPEHQGAHKHDPPSTRETT